MIEKIGNEEIKGNIHVSEKLREARLIWLGHVERNTG